MGLHLNGTLYKLTFCSSLSGALKDVAAETYGLILPAISLPDGNDIAVCKTLRKTDAITPVMMITCHAEETGKTLAPELGPDDCVTKTFGLFELKARIKASMRMPQQAANHLPEQKEINHTGLVIDPAKRKASLKEARFDLTAKEFDLMFLLESHPGKTFSRKELLQQICGYTFAGYWYIITSHLNRLRLKLETHLAHLANILTAWDAGYRFTE